MKKALLPLFLILFLCSCTKIAEQGIIIAPTADIEKTVHWMVDDAVMAASTQIMYEVRQEMNTRIPPTSTPMPLYTPRPSETPTVTSIWEGQRDYGEETPTMAPMTCTNRVKFVRDVTIPDGTAVTAGKPFTKTWELMNVGTCVWTEEYKFVFVDGDQFGANTVISFPKDTAVDSLGKIQISVYMTAPEKSGSYRGNWMIEAPNGERFGTGDNGDKAVWVKVEVK